MEKESVKGVEQIKTGFDVVKQFDNDIKQLRLEAAKSNLK